MCYALSCLPVPFFDLFGSGKSGLVWGLHMATREGKTRITITLGDAVLEKLDAYCEMSGLSRSAVIGDIVGTNLGVMEKMTKSVTDDLAEALGALMRASAASGNGGSE